MSKRTKYAMLRLTEEEHALLSKESAEQGRELAQHIRWLALEGRKLLAQSIERRPRSAALTPIDIDVIRGIIREETSPPLPDSVRSRG